MPSARDILGDGGVLSKALPGYEARPAQLAMADAVEATLAGDRRLLCEAGTGTGKTLAYLVPAILSGRKVVISTATKALQEQIVAHDLPLLVKHAGLRPNVALLKGLSNYLCRRRYEAFRVSPEALLSENAAALRTVSKWIHETDSGDLAELATLREAHPVRLEIASGSDTRVGQNCSFFERCFVTARKRDAEQAQILIVNHHLLFADLALRGPHQGGALPSYDAVVLDEAHQIEDVATEFFGTRVSSLRVETLLRDAERGFVAQTNISTTGPRLVHSARVAAETFFAAVASLVPDDQGRQPLPEGELPRELVPAYLALDGAVGVVGSLASDEGRGEALDVIVRRVQQLRDELAGLFEPSRRMVLWADVSARNVSLGASPIEIGGILKKRLFDTVGAAILTSATLRTGEDFSFVRERVGLTQSEAPVDELALSSPFDYPNRALLYMPRDLPEVSHPSFLREAGERIVQLVHAAGGGAFVLCTSVRAMRLLHQHLQARGVQPLLLQGEAPKSTLLSRFRSFGNAVLVATMSFWEGVDVPGDALRLVILDKVPFPVPSDPVVAARSLALEEAGGNPFMRYHVPAAAIALKQGFGRLLRTNQDRGVVALLDRRVLTKPYGKRLLKSLPDARRTEDFREVTLFFGGTPEPEPPPAEPDFDEYDDYSRYESYPDFEPPP
jgi:ATP-dependent DNA helicase DinG